MIKYILLILLFVTLETQAKVEKIALEPLVRHSDFTGVVKVVNIEKSEMCGYIVTAEPLKVFKGIDEEFKFRVTNEVDLMSGVENYFAILYEKPQSDTCGQNILSTFKDYQTLFPFKDIGDKFILASRKSFMAADGDSGYYPFKYVKLVEVVDNKIYAFGKWKDIEKDLLKF
ncbi:hypothetical protein CA267_010880 [Alteromonas pelagimontana]|uniref:Uncharacterized protein n=1 Tax=Alteromonas pelagimontana TaxID=1858656 RepID=A0A6M4MDR7_9ALTE|nr:hypothetical protein [Alteromonas pelagimontana]QJR81249.1 hypothetical protein CA267_010880 [Alteromonas pelagimontana]